MQRPEHGNRRQHVAAGVLGVRAQHLALAAGGSGASSYQTTAMLTISVTVISAMPSGKTRGMPPFIKPIDRRRDDLHQHDDQEHQDGERRHRLVLAMAVRVVGVGRPPRGRDADERDDVRGRSVREWKPSERIETAPVA